MSRNEWDYEVTGYGPFNKVLCRTVHKGEVSRDIEIAAWNARIANGEAVYVEVRDLRVKQEGL